MNLPLTWEPDLFYSTDELYVGISSTRLLAKRIMNYQHTESYLIATEKLIRHYYLTAGYTIADVKSCI